MKVAKVAGLAVGTALTVLFALIAFDLMPDGFVDATCAAGRTYGIDAPCYPFMWYAVGTGFFIGIAGPVIGSYLVHKEMALIGETLAHTAFAGVGFGLLFTATAATDTLLLAALVTSVVGALGVQFLAERTEAYGDVPIAIMLTGSFAVGTIVISYSQAAFIDIESFIFGSIVAVTRDSLRMMLYLTVAVVGTVAVAYKQLLYVTFDEQAARVARFNVSGYNSLLVLLTALVVVGSMQVLGVILVAAMLVIPVAAASQVADSFRGTLYLSVVVGELSVLGGLTASYVYSLAAGGSIVVVAIAFYLTAVVYSSYA